MSCLSWRLQVLLPGETRVASRVGGCSWGLLRQHRRSTQHPGIPFLTPVDRVKPLLSKNLHYLRSLLGSPLPLIPVLQADASKALAASVRPVAQWLRNSLRRLLADVYFTLASIAHNTPILRLSTSISASVGYYLPLPSTVHTQITTVQSKTTIAPNVLLDKWIYISTYGSIHQAMVSNETSGAISCGCEERTNESKTNNVHFKTTIAPNALLDLKHPTTNKNKY